MARPGILEHSVNGSDQLRHRSKWVEGPLRWTYPMIVSLRHVDSPLCFIVLGDRDYSAIVSPALP